LRNSQYKEDPTLYSLESRKYISILTPEERDFLITRYRELRAKEACIIKDLYEHPLMGDLN